MKKSNLTEEELKQIKEELKKELKAEMMEEVKKEETKKILEENKVTKTSKVSNATYQESAAKNTSFKIPDRKKSFFEPELIEKKKENANDVELEKTSPVLIISILALLIIGIIFVPKIYDKFGKQVKQDKIKDPVVSEPEKVEIKYKWEDQLIKEAYSPVMRDNMYQDYSYYMNDKMVLSDFSNNDILYNTLNNLYVDYIDDYIGGYNGNVCTNLRLSVDQNVLKIHLKNIFTKTLDIPNVDFTVPSHIGSSYPGLWKYHTDSSKFVYYGDCNPNPLSDTLHYDILIEDEIETKEEGKVANLIYYIAFAKVSNNNYEIYSDANYENKVLEGTLSGYPNELEDLVKMNKTSFKKYMYTYSTNNCPYKALCYVSGEYVR